MTGRWVLHVVRLLALCVAVVVARPAAAAPAVDRIVLVAEATARVPVSSPDGEDEASTRVRATHTSAPSSHARATPPAVRPWGATCIPLVLVPDKYLRNCSLLR